jgi:hypothetical protein
MSAINVNSITGRTGTHGPVLTGVTTATNGLNVTAGNVGIGTDSPFGKLQVHAGDDANFSFSTGGGESSLEILNDAGSANVPLNVRASEYKIKIQGNEKVRITSAGNVGIGLTNPEKNLVVSSNSSPTIRINNSDGSISADQTIGAIEFKANDGSGDGSQVTGSIESISQAAFTGQGSPSHLIFKTNGVSGPNALTERLRIDSGGEVQITNSGSSNGSTVQQLSLYTDNSGSGDNFTQRIAYTRANDTSKVFAAIDSVRTGTFNTDLVFSNDDAGVLGEKLRLISTGNVSITNGDLVVASGHGIDFSATADGSGTMTSELLDDYEEGTFTVTSSGILNQGSLQTARYIKIGNQVTYMFNFYQNSNNMSWSAGSFFSISAFTPISNFHTSPSISWFKSASSSDTQPAYFNSAGDIVLNLAQSSVRHLWGFVTIQVQ